MTSSPLLKPTITLVIPALNEEVLITPTVEQILECVEGRFSEYELLLVDDGSTDQTGVLMDRLAKAYPRIRVFHNARNLGLGYSYRLGVSHARYEYVMLLCGDGGLPAASLPAIFDQIGQADIVIPYMRNLVQIKTRGRFLLSRSYTMLLNTLFGLKLRYYNGLAVHRVDLVRAVDVRSDGFGFQGEILVKLLKGGCSFVQVAVDGAEKTNRSSALRFSNILSVTATLLLLIWEIARFDDSRVRAVGGAPRSSTGAAGNSGGAIL
jgi:dolichol-phosphate mannosyltransferase